MIKLIGDIHGQIKPYIEVDADYVIQLGDCGLIWNRNNYQDNIKKVTESCSNKMMLFIEGNHENFPILRKFPLVEFHGGPAYKFSDNFYCLKRNHIFDIDGHKILALGGADSYDKHMRKNRISWWEEEIYTYDDYLDCAKRIENKSIDFVLSHTCPQNFKKYMPYRFAGETLSDHNTDLVYLKIQNDFKKWYYAHWHMSINTEECRLLDINEVCKIGD